MTSMEAVLTVLKNTRDLYKKFSTSPSRFGKAGKVLVTDQDVYDIRQDAANVMCACANHPAIGIK